MSTQWSSHHFQKVSAISESPIGGWALIGIGSCQSSAVAAPQPGNLPCVCLPIADPTSKTQSYGQQTASYKGYAGHLEILLHSIYAS